MQSGSSPCCFIPVNTNYQSLLYKAKRSANYILQRASEVGEAETEAPGTSDAFP